MTKDAPFDPVKDFAGITRLGSAPLFLITYPEVPVKTVKDVIELAKKEPGKLNFSSPGLASTTFIAGALFRRIAGIDIVHVPFRSAPDAVTAVIRGDAQFYFAPSQSGARSVRGRQGEGDRCRDRHSAFRNCRTCRPSPKRGCRSSMTPGSA